MRPGSDRWKRLTKPRASLSLLISYKNFGIRFNDDGTVTCHEFHTHWVTRQFSAFLVMKFDSCWIGWMIRREITQHCADWHLVSKFFFQRLKRTFRKWWSTFVLRSFFSLLSGLTVFSFCQQSLGSLNCKKKTKI